MKTKKEIRAILNQKLNTLDKAYCKEADEKICQHVLSLTALKKATIICCFISREQEISTRPIIEEAWKQGKTVAVPKCHGKGRMDMYKITSYDDLEKGTLGILEPKMSCPLIPPEDIDFGIIPCLSCDKNGHRLGFGGGYYDRYLKDAHFPTAVICREEMLSLEIPVEPHDITINYVITENN